jgi:hypothetical protein
MTPSLAIAEDEGEPRELPPGLDLVDLRPTEITLSHRDTLTPGERYEMWMSAWGGLHARTKRAAELREQTPVESAKHHRDVYRDAKTKPDDSEARFSREVKAADRLVRECLDRLVELRAQVPELPPDEYRAARQELIDDWNAAMSRHGWMTLAPLCEGCGRPVLLHRQDRKNRKLRTTCSDACRERRKARKKKRRSTRKIAKR